MELLMRFGRDVILDVLRAVCVIVFAIAFLFAISLTALKAHGGGHPMDHYRIEQTGDPRPPTEPDNGKVSAAAWIISQAQATRPYIGQVRDLHLRL